MRVSIRMRCAALLNRCALRLTQAQKVFFLSALLTCLSAVAAASTPTVVVGNWIIPTGTAAFTIPLNVTGGDPVTGGNFIFEISQGGAFQATGGPNFVSIDMTSGGIFSPVPLANIGTTFSVRSNNSVVTSSIASGGPTYTPTATPAVKTKEDFFYNVPVAANGALGNLVVSTAGVAPGVYDLRMTAMVTGGGGGSTSTFVAPGFSLDYGSFTNGTITVVPEPSTLALAAFGFAGLAAWRWRRRR